MAGNEPDSLRTDLSPMESNSIGLRSYFDAIFTFTGIKYVKTISNIAITVDFTDNIR